MFRGNALTARPASLPPKRRFGTPDHEAVIHETVSNIRSRAKPVNACKIEVLHS